MTAVSDALGTLQYQQQLAEKVQSTLNFNSLNAHESFYSNYTKNIIDEIIDEIQRVNNQELRMTIVASMKSGKSTIINALIGEDILPTRSDAMTTIPTEIIFKREINEPTLYLSQELISTMNKIQEHMRYYLTEYPEETTELFENEPQISKLIYEIQNNTTRMLQNHTTNVKQIQDALVMINDLMRSHLKLIANSTIVDIKQVNLQALQKGIPRIEIPFTNTVADNVGSLVIVDTPGPNEARMCGQLEEIVTAELRKAGIILVVFNYTTLGTQSDEKIMEEITELRKINGDSDCIYAVINKVDQRRKGDLSKEDVKKLIASKYNIEELSTDHDSGQRIFETKAIFGLTSKRFLIEYERLKEKNITPLKTNMKTYDDLGLELYDYNWESDQETITLEQLYKGALDMWKKSGLDELLQSTVSSLMKRIESRIVKSVMGKCQRADRELIKYLKLRQATLDADEQELNAERRELEQDKLLIEEIRSQQHMNIERFLKILNSSFPEIENRYETAVKHLLAQWPTPKDWQYYILEKKSNPGLVLGGFTTATCLTTGIAIGSVLGGLSTVALSVYYLWWDNMSNSIRFPNKDEADKFCGAVTEMIYEICETVSIPIDETVDADCNRVSTDLYNFLRGKTSKVLERAEKTLNVTFEIKQPMVEKFDRKFEKSSIEEQFKLHENNNFLYGKYEFYISHDDLLKQCEQLINDTLMNSKEARKKWFADWLEKNYTTYLNKLEVYLNMYMNFVQSSLKDINLTKVDQENFRQTLQELIDELNVQLQKFTII